MTLTRFALGIAPGTCFRSVATTDAALMPDKVKIALIVTTEPPVLYPIAVVAAGRNVAAERFVAAVASPPAQAVLARYGFGKP